MNQPFPSAIASDPSSVYWINASPAGSLRVGGVMRSSFVDPSPAFLQEVTTLPQNGEHVIVVDEQHVYWASSALEVPGYRDSSWSIRRIAKGL
ncbi:MAG: hypothetical protein QM756_35425 [Polyangiaceae bacterium]